MWFRRRSQSQMPAEQAATVAAHTDSDQVDRWISATLRRRPRVVAEAVTETASSFPTSLDRPSVFPATVGQDRLRCRLPAATSRASEAQAEAPGLGAEMAQAAACLVKALEQASKEVDVAPT